MPSGSSAETPFPAVLDPERVGTYPASSFAPDAPANRVDIIRGLADWPPASLEIP